MYMLQGRCRGECIAAKVSQCRAHWDTTGWHKSVAAHFCAAASHSSCEPRQELMTPDSMALRQMVVLAKSTMTCVLTLSAGGCPGD